MSADPISSEMRAVLEAPRGRRFSRTHSAPPRREQRRVALIDEWSAWEPQRPHEPTPAPSRSPKPLVPNPRPAPDDGPWVPRPRPEHPPLPRRPRRPHSHRKPRRRRRIVWPLFGYALAALAGAFAHHLTAGLL